MRPPTALTLALIGGQRLLREATASLLTAQDGLHVQGDYASAAEFLDAASTRPPAVLLVDCDGVAAPEYAATVHTLSAPAAPWRMVLLCSTPCEELIECAIAHRAGGVLLKSYSTDDIRAALAYTATGRTVLPAGWQHSLAPRRAGWRRQLPSQPAGACLTPRHRQILALIAAGRRNEEIALDLDLSPNTIKFHVRALYSRLGVCNRVQAASLHAQIAGERHR